jgi:hypothetical protein
MYLTDPCERLFLSGKHREFFIVLWLIGACLFSSASAQEIKTNKTEPLLIQEQGSFAFGGKVFTNSGAFNPKQPTPDGQTLHGDHAYVFYEIPVNRRKLPLVFLHGTGQFSKTWETTPDGREGFQTIFLRRRLPVYLTISRDAETQAAARSRQPSMQRQTSRCGLIRFGSASGRITFPEFNSRKTLKL